jgi:hypothetical protein
MLKRHTCLVAALLCLFVRGAFGYIFEDDHILMRGDVNSSGSVTMADATYLNGYLYSGGPAPPCMNQADVNGDGTVNGSDAVYLLQWLYSGGPAPPSPGPYNTTCACVEDTLGCAADPCS